jgi:hypothetical protein
VTGLDPGPDGKLGTADDTGKSFTYYEYPASLQGAQFNQTRLVNDTRTTAFKSIEVAFTKRMSQNWQMEASYSGTRKHINNIATLPTDDPNADFNQFDNSYEWISKISGSYTFRGGVQTSAILESRSGNSYARSVLFSGGKTIPTYALNVESIGAEQYPTATHLDVRVEKQLKVLNTSRLSVRLNVYNLLNSNTILAATSRSGPSFGVPTSILPARLAEVSASYKF